MRFHKGRCIPEAPDARDHTYISRKTPITCHNDGHSGEFLILDPVVPHADSVWVVAKIHEGPHCNLVVDCALMGRGRTAAGSSAHQPASAALISIRNIAPEPMMLAFLCLTVMLQLYLRVSESP